MDAYGGFPLFHMKLGEQKEEASWWFRVERGRGAQIDSLSDSCKGVQSECVSKR